MNESETSINIIDATDSEKYPHTEEGKLKFLRDIYKIVGKFGTIGKVSRSSKLFEKYLEEFEFLIRGGRIKISEISSENPCEENKADAITSLRRKVAQREAFANLPVEKQEALKTIVEQLTSKQIKAAGHISVEEIKKRAEKIKELGLPMRIFPFLSFEKIKTIYSLLSKTSDEFFKKITLAQIKECEEINYPILVKYYDILKNVQPEEKIGDIVKNAQTDEALGKISF